ncbi:hypothetical protein GGR25_001849 [Kaistia hirudinis]|uniref:Uncharacterized protein n=1 Tax=Kaistia hirudinis TaxID=1293440 RepID=A0A840AKN8_9HYPH|nr:hypothetical protein [Kaistia hirudinis]
MIVADSRCSVLFTLVSPDWPHEWHGRCPPYNTRGTGFDPRHPKKYAIAYHLIMMWLCWPIRQFGLPTLAADGAGPADAASRRWLLPRPAHIAGEMRATWCAARARGGARRAPARGMVSGRCTWHAKCYSNAVVVGLPIARPDSSERGASRVPSYERVE